MQNLTKFYMEIYRVGIEISRVFCMVITRMTGRDLNLKPSNLFA